MAYDRPQSIEHPAPRIVRIHRWKQPALPGHGAGDQRIPGADAHLRYQRYLDRQPATLRRMRTLGNVSTAWVRVSMGAPKMRGVMPSGWLKPG